MGKKRRIISSKKFAAKLANHPRAKQIAKLNNNSSTIVEEKTNTKPQIVEPVLDVVEKTPSLVVEKPNITVEKVKKATPVAKTTSKTTRKTTKRPTKSKTSTKTRSKSKKES